MAAAPDSAAVVLSVTALGDLGGRPPVLRSGARPGDVVALAGRLGWSACGLAVLRRGFTSPLGGGGRAPAAHAAVRGRPGRRRRRARTAMCDVSDGLLADAGHIADASGVVLDLDRAALVRACLEPPGPLQQVGVGPRRGPDGLGAHRRRGPRAARHLPARRRRCPRGGRRSARCAPGARRASG